MRTIVVVALLASATAQAADLPPTAPFLMPDLATGHAAGVALLIGRIRTGAENGRPGTLVTAAVAGALRVNPVLVVSLRAPWMLLTNTGDNETTVSGVGAVAIGGQLTPFSTTTGGARLRFGGGLAMALPTAGADTARGDWLHGGEPTRFAANTLAFHVHADARVDRGRLFAQAQLGAERAAPTDDRPGSGSWTFRSGVAAGVAVGFGVAALAELATTSAVSAGLRWHARSVTVAVRAYVPLDASLRSADVFAIGIDAAARF